MENSASGRNVEISKPFSDGSHKKDSSIIFVYGDLSDTASPSTDTGAVDAERGEQANASASCVFSENDMSFQHTTVFENPPKELKDCEKDPPDSSRASCSPLSDQGKDFASVDVINEKHSKGSLKKQSQIRVLSRNQRDKVCDLTINNPPIMIKKVTPISKSHHGISKSKLPSVSILRNEILTDMHPKRYPPISVQKTVPLLESRTPAEGDESKSKSVDSFNRMNAQHSAQCMKQGQVKCDFVCSLYKSNDWTKNSTPNLFGKFKQKNKKKSAHVVVKNITNNNKASKLLNEDNTFGNEAKHLKCLFCEKYFGWKAITCLKLDGPLPSSFMNPVSLLQHFGITLSIPVYGPDKKDLTFINVCRICYNLVVSGDELYQKFQSIANQMRHLWPKHAIDNNSSDENFQRYSSPAGESYENKTVSDVKGKKKDFGKKPQYILPKSKVDEGVSVNVIISPELEALINMNEERYNSVMDEEKVKPKIVRTEPLTCGLCGKDFYADDQWKYHLEHYHRVQKKWHRFTPKSHTTFRGHIISELIKFNSDQKGFEWCNDYKSRQSVSKEGENNHICAACGNTFSDQSSFVVHLRSFHNIVVDDSLLFGTGSIGSYKKLGNQKSDKEKVSNQSEIISVTEQGLAKSYPDRDVHFNVNKLEKVEENGCNKSEILHKSCLESDAETSGNSLLNTAYCQNQDIGGTALSSNGPGEKPDMNRDADQKNDTQDNVSSTEYKCLICFKNFNSKKGLENHVETTHLSSSVILKGDETVGIVDYSVDVQDGDTIARKLSEEPSLPFEGTVDRTAELMDWQSDNILGSSYLSDNRIKSNKNQLDKEMLRHLVYECELCSRRIAGKKLLLLHMKRMHDITMDLPIAGRLRYCKYCLFRCSDHHLLRDHQKEKHGHCKEPDRQQCETCGKIYSSKYIQEHKSVMHGSERKHSCSLCGMKFFDKKGWRNHFYLEHANKEWKCVKCDLVFKKYHQLRQHVSYIHSTKEFKCDKCSKTYKRKGDLTVHCKRAHEKAVSCCNYCGKQYRSISKLKVHLVNVHGLSREETYSHRYARHKRANNKLCLAGKASTSNLPSDKTLEIPEGSEVEDTCIRIEKSSSELQLAEVIESTSNDLDEVTVLILS